MAVNKKCELLSEHIKAMHNVKSIKPPATGKINCRLVYNYFLNTHCYLCNTAR